MAMQDEIAPESKMLSCWEDAMSLSVIVTAYNVEKYLEECLESVLSQTYKDFEIIIVDDGSTDATAAICERYAARDSRIRVLHQANSGMSKARYAGFSAAKGKYVTFVDGDDKIMPETYETALSRLEPDVDMIAYGCIRWDPFGLESKEDPNKIPPGVYDERRLREQVYPRMLWNSAQNTMFDLDPSMCLKITRREIMEKAMEATKDVATDYGEDTLRIFSLMKFVKKMIILPNCLYFHRQRPSGRVAPYIKNPDFFQKLCAVYYALVKNLDFHPSLLEQVDYFFMVSSRHKERCYKTAYNALGRYLFPFQDVPLNASVILYGAGAVGKSFYAQILRTGYCKIVLWVDKAWEKYEDADYAYKISPVEKVKDVAFDRIVICNAKETIRQDIKQHLRNLGVAESKIVSNIS